MRPGGHVMSAIPILPPDLPSVSAGSSVSASPSSTPSAASPGDAPFGSALSNAVNAPFTNHSAADDLTTATRKAVPLNEDQSSLRSTRANQNTAPTAAS